MEQHHFLQAVIFPNFLKNNSLLNLTDEDYQFLYREMSILPRESLVRAYNDYGQYPDGHVKFILYGESKDRIPDNVRIFNKVGMAYGFVLDNAYVIDFENKVEFLLSAVVYVNHNETLNDNKELYIKSEDLKFLELSFSRNGIQALIIENVLPSLELEANKLLSYLTENRLSINLQIRKGRRLKNTEDYSQEIDIIIADENGAVREYETYSGGESFRIDFAIRIALSRLVSLRSGVRSPILFIDEGFGSQDQIGQDRLREAIQEISNSENYKFKKIIVITHLESLKESFGVALEVSKNENSSYFSLN